MTDKNENVSRLGSYMIKGLLLVSGLIAVGIAVAILFMPDAFYAGYGIDTGANVSLANELKAPAGMLLIAGLLVLAGVFTPRMTAASLAMASLIYLSYGLSRLLSMAIDGIPHGGLVSAAMLEVFIGLVCLLAFTLSRKSTFGARNVGQGDWNAPVEEIVQ
tara:strand:+ start:8111 stop:8593 length:483 start_codon:yes stop_codon:yes gene_type:complete